MFLNVILSNLFPDGVQGSWKRENLPRHPRRGFQASFLRLRVRGQEEGSPPAGEEALEVEQRGPGQEQAGQRRRQWRAGATPKLVEQVIMLL